MTRAPVSFCRRRIACFDRAVSAPSRRAVPTKVSGDATADIIASEKLTSSAGSSQDKGLVQTQEKIRKGLVEGKSLF
jgi:hypothetical protein